MTAGSGWGQLEFGREDSCARLHQLSASVLAAFDKELPDLSYGCPSTQQQDELATTLWTNLCQPNGAWVTPIRAIAAGIAKAACIGLCKRLSVAISIQNRPCGNTEWLPVVTQIGLGSGVCVRSQAGIGRDVVRILPYFAFRGAYRCFPNALQGTKSR